MGAEVSPTATALAAQRALIDARRAETITELRRAEAECCLCGEGPTDGRELRMFDPAPGWTQPDMICRACFDMRGEEADFAALEMVWPVLPEANR